MRQFLRGILAILLLANLGGCVMLPFWPDHPGRGYGNGGHGGHHGSRHMHSGRY